MGSTKIQTVTPSPQPTATDSAAAWAAALPQIYATQLQYAPLEAQQQLALTQQYALPYAQALKTAQDTLYPNETELTNTLTQQTQEGLQSDLPDWAKESYMDTMRAQLGDNALSGAGADYMSRGLLEQQQNWKQYYQNLGLSISGKQPIYSAQQPQYSNYMSSFTPSSVYGNMANTYGTYTQGTQRFQQPNQAMQWMQGIGNVMQGVAGQGKGLMGWF